MYHWKSAKEFRHLSYSKQIVECHSGTKYRTHNAAHALKIMQSAARMLKFLLCKSVIHTYKTYKHTLTHTALRLIHAFGRTNVMFKPKDTLKCWGHWTPPLFAGYIRKTTAWTRCWRWVSSCRAYTIQNYLLNFQKLKLLHLFAFLIIKLS